MISKIMIAVFLVTVLFANAFSQLHSCRMFISCSTQIVSNGCNNIVRWTRCDGSNGYRQAGCRNTGCIRNCTCDCDENGYSQSWCVCPNDTLVIGTFECSGCPTQLTSPFYFQPKLKAFGEIIFPKISKDSINLWIFLDCPTGSGLTTQYQIHNI